MRIFALIIAMSVSTLAHATTWGSTEVDDPIIEGEKCVVHQPKSSGSYIYNWPSKYDLVFWPLTNANGIWHCSGSGFTAFIGDFKEMSADEKDRIKIYLKKNPPKDHEIGTQLKLLEAIYGLREKDAVFKNKLLRVLARWYQSLDQLKLANNYREKALKDIVVQLKASLPEHQRLEYLYIATNYARQLGEEVESDRYLAQLKAMFDSVTDEKAKGAANYLKHILPDSRYIQPGGKIDPAIAS